MYIPPEAMPCQRSTTTPPGDAWSYARSGFSDSWVIWDPQGKPGYGPRHVAIQIKCEAEAKMLAAAQEMQVALTWLINNWAILVGNRDHAQVQKVWAKVRSAWEKATYG
jgi:hypothetical protein